MKVLSETDELVQRLEECIGALCAEIPGPGGTWAERFADEVLEEARRWRMLAGMETRA